MLRTLSFCLALLTVAWAAAAVAGPRNPNGVAVIIGNTDYEGRIPRVEYAARDAEAIKRYVIDVLGFDEDNIIDLRDATKAQLESAFGNERSHQGLLWRYIDPSGGSDVVVYFSGHGVPGQKDKRGYLLPVDADPNTAEINGYPIDGLMANLSKLRARSMTVMLEACFSGDSHRGMLIGKASPVFIKPKLPEGVKMTVLTAASGAQLASWDDSSKHGLFTTHLLDALYGEADSNRDGLITLSETEQYLNLRMTRAARRIHGRVQNAMVGGNRGAILAAYNPGRAPQRPQVQIAPGQGGQSARLDPDDRPKVPTAETPPMIGEPKIDPIDAEYVTIKNANARSSPSVTGAKIATLPKDTRIVVLGKVRGTDWYAVEMIGGQRAYIYAGLLRDVSTVDVTRVRQAEISEQQRRQRELEAERRELERLRLELERQREAERNAADARKRERERQAALTRQRELERQRALERERERERQRQAALNFNPSKDTADKAYSDKDYATALKHYRGLADRGDSWGQFRLGWLYRKGLGVTQSDTEAVYWYRKSANQGQQWAQNNLGFMYDEGYGVPKNDATAVAWYRKAAAQGNRSGQFNMGKMYEYGQGVPKDRNKAIEYYRKAAAQNHDRAKKALRDMGAN